MAKTKKTAGTMSRRQMVTLLGSGVVFAGTVRAGDFSSAAQSVCQPVVPSVGRGADGRLVLAADPCCEASFEMIHANFGGPVATSGSKHDLQLFHDKLADAKAHDLLLEYSLMVFGLTAPQRRDLVQYMQKQYSLKPLDTTSAK